MFGGALDGLAKRLGLRPAQLTAAQRAQPATRRVGLLGALALYFLIAALFVSREKLARVSWKWYMLVFAIVAVVVVAGVLLCGLFLPYDQRFRLAHHNPAQWRAACRAAEKEAAREAAGSRKRAPAQRAPGPAAKKAAAPAPAAPPPDL